MSKTLRLDAPEDGRTPTLQSIGMRVLTDQVFVAALAMGHDSAEIGLGPGYREHAGFHAEKIRGEGLEFVDARILPVDVVAHDRRGHGLAHPGRRLSQRVTSKIDHPSFPTPQHSEKNEIITSAVRAGSS